MRICSIAHATKWWLQLAASDINLAVPTKLLDAEAELIAQKILDAVEVTDPALVPSVRRVARVGQLLSLTV
jgi:hypothetical protein